METTARNRTIGGIVIGAIILILLLVLFSCTVNSDPESSPKKDPTTGESSLPSDPDTIEPDDKPSEKDSDDPEIVDDARDYEVCFAGDWSPLREEMLADLARNFKVSIWGTWKRRLARDSILNDCIVKDGFFTPEEMAGIFNRSQVVLNIHTWFGKWDYGLNRRVFEANGCGAFQLCDFKEEIAEHYEVGREIVLYRSLSELKDRLGYYLRHPGELAGIAKQGCARTHRDHTYAKRLEEMFSQCGLK